MELKHTTITCPHCGHHLHISLDYSNGDQDYYEDCANCCSPIHVLMRINEVHKKLEIAINSDDEQVY